MTRVTSNKVRQFIFVVNETFEAGFTPDRVAFFMPDGRPIDLTFDGTRMRWAGAWNLSDHYVKNDVVVEQGNLYIAIADAIAAGGDKPTDEIFGIPDGLVVPGTDSGTAGADGSHTPAYRLIGGERVRPASTAPTMFFFDLATGGTVTVTDISLPNEYLKLYDAAGTQVGLSNLTATGSFGTPMVVTGLSPGRYYVLVQEGIISVPPEVHVRVVPSDGAIFSVVIPHWALVFKATDLTAIQTHLSTIDTSLTSIGVRFVSAEDRLTALETAPPGDSILAAWKGAWAAGAYLAGSIVRHTSGLYIASTNATALNEPGVTPADEMALMPGAWAGGGPYSVPRSTGASRAFVGGGSITASSTVFFDVTTAGTVILDRSVSCQVIRLTSDGNYSAEQIGTIWDMGSLAVGRYFLSFRDGTGTFTLGGTAVLSPGSNANPWDRMVQGV